MVESNKSTEKKDHLKITFVYNLIENITKITELNYIFEPSSLSNTRNIFNITLNKNLPNKVINDKKAK